MKPLLFILIFAIASQFGIHGKGSKIRPKSRNHKANQKLRQMHPKQSHDNKLESLNSMSSSFLFRNSTSEERLLAYLFQDYEPVARGVVDTNKTVEVAIDFVLLRIHGLDERSQVLTTTGLVIAEWTDERLIWDPEMFDDLTSIIIKAEQIWLPELALMNGADELMPDFERIRVLLHYNGRLHWEPGGIFRTTCDIDIAYFPFDSQNCLLLIGAYSYYSTKMNITNASSSISTHDFRISGEWQVHTTLSQWNITMLGQHGDGYSHVVFTLNLRRRFKFYIMNIVLPCVMLSVLIMVGFCLPPDAGEKISLGISVLLAFTVFLLMIADTIPRTSLAIPLIVTYLMVTMTLGTLSVCMTVLVLNLHHRGSKHTPPSWVSTLVLIYLAKLVCMQVDVPAPLYSQRRREKLLCHVCCRLDEAARESDPDGGNHAKRTDCNSLPLQLLTIPQRRQKQQQTVANHNNLQSVWMKRIAEDRDDLPTGQKRKNADEIAEDMKTSTDEKDSDEEISSSSFCSPNSCPISLNKSLPKIPKLCFKQRKTRTDIECHSCSNPGRQACPQTPVNYSIISDINRTFCETRSNRNHFSRGVVTEPRDKSKSSENRAENVEHEWHEIARVLDRVFFWVIFLMMSASTAVILFYPKYSNLPKDDD